MGKIVVFFSLLSQLAAGVSLKALDEVPETFLQRHRGKKIAARKVQATSTTALATAATAGALVGGGVVAFSMLMPIRNICDLMTLPCKMGQMFYEFFCCPWLTFVRCCDKFCPEPPRLVRDGWMM